MSFKTSAPASPATPSHYMHQPMPVSFQFLSDLHLEFHNQYATFKIPCRAHNLILAGDIGCLKDYDLYLGFLTRHIGCYARILLVLGNHEFYGLTYEEGLEAAQRLETEEVLEGKLRVLTRDNGTVEIPISPKGGEGSVTILGCTLWSNIPEEATKAVVEKVKDFKEINDWTVMNHNQEHRRDMSWLKREIELWEAEKKRPRTRLAIVTHHPPAMEECSNPVHASNPWNSAFGTELLRTEEDHAFKKISCWIFGHTHYTTQFWKGGVRVVSNQRGYKQPEKEVEEDKRGSSSFVSKFKTKEQPGSHEFDPCRVINI